MSRRVPRVAIPPRLWNANEAGRNWETELDRLHTRYNADKRACIFRTPAEVKNAGGKFVRTAKKGVPDWTGVVGPYALLIEAKTAAVETPKKAFTLAMVDDAQAETMSAWEDQGPHLAIVLYFDREREDRWCIPWEDLRPRWERWHADDDFKRGEASLTIDQLEGIAFKFDPIQGWLPAFLRWVNQRAVAR